MQWVKAIAGVASGALFILAEPTAGGRATWAQAVPGSPALTVSAAAVTATGMSPGGAVGQPEDIARVAVFLASDDAGWLTGEIIFANGGNK
jgi:NAD(P)-dependent dehydrogenase (short-subunit alcohol dehydrogenase family)